MVREYIWSAAAALMTVGVLASLAAVYLYKKEQTERKKLVRLFLLWALPAVGISILFEGYEYSFWLKEKYYVLLFAMLLLADIDKREKKLPNMILAVLMGIRTVFLLVEVLVTIENKVGILVSAIIGLMGSFLIMMIAYYISRRALGLGDVKLFAVTGFYLGFSLNYLVLVVSLIYAAVFSLGKIVFKRLKMKDEIAFGPFAALGLWTVLLLGFS